MNSTKRIADIINIEDYLSKQSELSIKEYNKLFDHKFKHPSPYYFLKFFIIEKLPTVTFRFEHQENIEFLKRLVSTQAILEETYNYPGEPMGLTLYELIRKYGKIPNRIIGSTKDDILTMFDLYEEYKFIYRFFQNQGRVYFSESMRNIYEHKWLNACHRLLRKGVLRKGSETERSLVLNFKTKTELLDIIALNNIPTALGDRIHSQTKKIIIDSIQDSKIINDLNLPQYFYFLSDAFQELKEWIEKEEIYFKVFCLLNIDITDSYISLDTILKDLIRIEDHETAYKLIQLYPQIKSQFAFHSFEDKSRLDSKIIRYTKKITANRLIS